jgi:hypothetical protein
MDEARRKTEEGVTKTLAIEPERKPKIGLVVGDGFEPPTFGL